jgi:hypothetical protein
VVIGQHLQIQLGNLDLRFRLATEGRCVRTAIDRVRNSPLIMSNLLRIVDARRNVPQTRLRLILGLVSLGSERSRLRVPTLILFLPLLFFLLNPLFKILNGGIVTEFSC